MSNYCDIGVMKCFILYCTLLRYNDISAFCQATSHHIHYFVITLHLIMFFPPYLLLNLSLIWSKSVMITFLREWWNCRQKQPSQQESRPGADDNQHCQSYARFHNIHRTAQNTAGNPKNGKEKLPKRSPKLNT